MTGHALVLHRLFQKFDSVWAAFAGFWSIHQ
jgi:hypothetical protein